MIFVMCIILQSLLMFISNIRHPQSFRCNTFLIDGSHEGETVRGKFNSAWRNYVLWTTTQIYKELRGIIGLTLKDKALTRCFLAWSVVTKYLMTFHNRVCQSTVKPNQKEQYKKQLYGYVVKMIQLFDSWFNDPFDIKEHTPHTSNIFWNMF